MKDQTSDMAMIAERFQQSKVRAKRDENKSRDRFWDVKNSKIGDITGAISEEDKSRKIKK